LVFFPTFTFFNISSSFVPIPNATKPAVVGGCELILRPETRDEYLAYDPAGKGLEWKKFWFHVGNFESPLPERVPGAPKSKKTGQVMDLVASKLIASSKPLRIGKIKESPVIMWSSPL